ncbi:TPA: hypothetical protein QDZ58_000467 [Pluralibacter gergoviae]|nr:hypothetical protein [Pluralibacter gergoviae]
MKKNDVVIFNNQQCDRSIVMLVIDKVLPTVLEVVAEKIKRGDPEEGLSAAATAVVNAAIKSISVKASRELESSPLVDAWPERELRQVNSTSQMREEGSVPAGGSPAPAGTQESLHQHQKHSEGYRSPFSYEVVGDDLRITLKGFR